MSKIAPENLQKFNKPAPRYTSYPTAPNWEPLKPSVYAEKLVAADDPLSLYFHIPFCKTMCLYCGCSVVLNRRPENEALYVDYLCKEIDLVTQKLGSRKTVHQIHFGGGTPTKLTEPLFRRLFEKICLSFDIDFSKEIAIEIDPRTVVEDDGAKLKFLKELGFNRVSFGVQDTNEQVQEAVKRRQSYEMTKTTYEMARQLGFDGINIDLIYGLPYQTIETFHDTVAKMIAMRPDRISLFSYAKVPWLKPHQNAIKEETLPDASAKFQIYTEAREAFIQSGYVAIGMDHFALERDELSTCYHEKRLQRNFQGYAVQYAHDQIGFGVTAIGFVQNCYAQNIKKLPDYYAALDNNTLPIHLGKELSEDDKMRKWLIHTIMCRFELDKKEFEALWQRPFDFDVQELIDDGLIEQTADKLLVTPLGELFIRLVAMQFDAYIKPKAKLFSQSI